MSMKTVLIVDDDQPMRNVLRQGLTLGGYHVLEAADGQEALALFQDKRPDMVITDIYMPKMNGIHLLRAIRRVDPSAKVVLITGYAHYSQLRLDARSRPDGFFEKPFSLQELFGKVEQLIGKPSDAPAQTVEQLSPS